MRLGCFFGLHRWAVTTWRTNVILRVDIANDKYDERPDGREIRWVPFGYCLDCGVLQSRLDR